MATLYVKTIGHIIDSRTNEELPYALASIMWGTGTSQYVVPSRTKSVNQTATTTTVTESSGRCYFSSEALNINSDYSFEGWDIKIYNQNDVLQGTYTPSLNHFPSSSADITSYNLYDYISGATSSSKRHTIEFWLYLNSSEPEPDPDPGPDPEPPSRTGYLTYKGNFLTFGIGGNLAYN